jgi:hypothetical protein
MFVQMKGKGLTDSKGSQSVQGGGDKRQCTAMIATAADGSVLPGQLVRAHTGAPSSFGGVKGERQSLSSCCLLKRRRCGLGKLNGASRSR